MQTQLRAGEIKHSYGGQRPDFRRVEQLRLKVAKHGYSPLTILPGASDTPSSFTGEIQPHSRALREKNSAGELGGTGHAPQKPVAKGKSGNPAKRARQEMELQQRAAERGAAFGALPPAFDPSQFELPAGFEKYLKK